MPQGYNGGNFFAPTYAGGQGGSMYTAPNYSLSNTYGVGNTSTGTAFSAAAGGGGYGQFAGAVVQGLNSYFSSRAAGNAALEAAKGTVKETREGNAQRRKTLEYEAALGDWTAQSDRKRRSDALREYLKVARAEGPNSGSAIGQMTRTDSPHQVADPGARPDPNKYQVAGPVGG